MSNKNKCHVDEETLSEDGIKKIKDLNDKLLRAVAEAENTKKRLEREKEDAIKFCVSSFAKDILIIRDNLKLAISNCEKTSDINAIVDGIKMTLVELEKVLKNHGIVAIDAKDKVFDPHFHQAILEIHDQSREHGTIIDVIQDGFMIKDRLLRPSVVSVSKKKNEE